ncbi:MAG: ABC transporter permease [Alkalispirochaeta sp.]
MTKRTTRFFRREEPGIIQFLPTIVSVVPAAGILFLDLIRLRPNRITEGETFALFDAGLFRHPSTAIVFAAVVIITALAVLGAVHFQDRISRATGWRADLIGLYLWTLVITVLPWIIFQFAAEELARTDQLDDVARISPGGALWLALISALAAWHELLRNSRGILRWITGAVLAVTAVTILSRFAVPPLDRLSYLVEYDVRSDRFLREVARHVRLSGTAVALACLIGVPSGITAHRYPRLRDAILDITSTIQTIPSLAMFGLLIAPLAALSRAVPALRRMGVSGVGTTPAIIALTVYALLPVVRNTVTGLAVIPDDIRESGRAMGMTDRQRFWMVEMPLAFPVLLRGIRTAAVQAVGNTTVAGLIGAGGLGWFVFQGLGQAATDLVVLGVIPIVVLAIAVDRLFQVLQRVTTPAGTFQESQ